MGEIPKISVIIPVYNTEAYLSRCLASVTAQDWEDLEILLVDDGSEDGSGRLCAQWAEKDGRIRVIRQENCGLGMARNRGLSEASGDFAVFVDSDDALEAGALKKAADRLTGTGADLCYYGLTDMWPDGRIRRAEPPERLYYEGSGILDFVKDILGQEEGESAVLFAGVSACGVMVRRDFLERCRISFQSERDILCEDLLFNVQACLRAERVAIEPSCLYQYWHNGGDSLTGSYRRDRLEAAKRLYFRLSQIAGREGLLDVLDRRIQRSFMINLIVCLKHEVRFRGRNGTLGMFRNLRAVCRDSAVQEVLGRYPLGRMPKKQRLLFQAVKRRQAGLVWLMVWLQENRPGRRPGSIVRRRG